MQCSGIYKIENIINGKIYIGSTVNFRNRKYTHFSMLRNNNHHCNYLQNSFNKYGEINFIFSVLEYHEIEGLIQREQEYLDFFEPEYNMAKKATGYETTEEKRKILFGGNKGKKQSKEIIRKRSERCKKSIYQFDLEGNFIKKWKSAIEAAKELNCSLSIIRHCLLGNKPSASGSIWDYSSKLEKNDKRLHVKRIKEILQLDLDGKIIRRFKQVKDAEGFICKKGAAKNIAGVLNGKRKSAYGYKWERIYA